MNEPTYPSYGNSAGYGSGRGSGHGAGASDGDSHYVFHQSFSSAIDDSSAGRASYFGNYEDCALKDFIRKVSR